LDEDGKISLNYGKNWITYQVVHGGKSVEDKLIRVKREVRKVIGACLSFTKLIVES